MKKILYVVDRGCNIQYLDFVLKVMQSKYDIEFDRVGLQEYSKIGMELQKNYDILIYQTFPHQYHPDKWNGNLIDVTDNIFNSFSGYKIFHDAHDSGSVDSFSRFNDDTIPRIKCTPTYEFLEKFNVVMCTAQGWFLKDRRYPELVGSNDIIDYPKSESIYYSVSYGYDPKYADGKVIKGLTQISIREKVRDLLKNYKRVGTNMEWKNGEEYFNHLTTMLVSICSPGWSEATFRHLESLLAGCLLLSHDCINSIKLLPHVDLIENEDYMSYNLDNLHDKLDYIFNNREEIDRIRVNGKKKIHKGYDIIKSADKFYNKVLGLYA